MDTLPTHMDTLPTPMARGLLMPSQRLMPRLIPLFSTALLDMVDTLPTLPTVSVPMDTLPTPMDIIVTMARGLLMLRPMPRLIPLFSTAPLDMVDTLPTLPTVSVPTDTLPTPMDIMVTMARGLLMPSPRPMPRLIPLFSTALLDMVDTLPTIT